MRYRNVVLGLVAMTAFVAVMVLIGYVIVQLWDAAMATCNLAPCAPSADSRLQP